MSVFTSSKSSSNGIYSLNNINSAILKGKWPGSLEDVHTEPTTEFLLKFEEVNGSQTYFNSINKFRWFYTSRAVGKGGTGGNGSIVNTRSKFGSSCYGNNTVGQYYFRAYDGIFMNGRPIELGTKDFTIEGWIYLTTLDGNSGNIFTISTVITANLSSNDSPDTLNLSFGSNGKLVINRSGSRNNISSESSSSLSTNVWQHIALVRKNGIYTVYLDGNSILNFIPNTTIDTSDFNYLGRNLFSISNRSFLRLSSLGDTTVSLFTNIASNSSVFADDIMFTNNVAKYNNNFNVPDTEFIADPQPSILYYNHFENEAVNTVGGGQRDLTERSERLFSNTTLSSDDKKFGSSSLYLNGTYQQILMNPKSASGDFNISIWIKPSVVSECPIFFINNLTCYLRVGGGTYNTKSGFQNPNNGSVAFTIGNTTIRSANNLVTTNTWHHIHVSRNNNTIRLFLNGNQVATGSSSSDFITQNSTMVIGLSPRIGPGEQSSSLWTYNYPIYLPEGRFSSSAKYYYGYIDEFIIDNKTGLTSVSVPTESIKYILGS